MVRRRIVTIVSIVCIVLGIGVISFPHIEQWLYSRNADRSAMQFDEWREEMWEQAGSQEPQPGEASNYETPEEAPYLSELYGEMQKYNESLYRNGQAEFKDAWSYQSKSFDLTQWGFDDQMIGYIHIPRMDVRLPLYLGATEKHMKLGAVHLTETSLPIGGKNTNCVIAGHRGYHGAAMFRDIEELRIGDEIYIHNPWETLVYRVCELKVIAPDETGEVMIQPGRDLVTLITCHPYRHNYQRYVVYAERIG